jgi:hypothetical protein
MLWKCPIGIRFLSRKLIRPVISLRDSGIKFLSSSIRIYSMSEILTLTLKTHIKVLAKAQHKVAKVDKVDKVGNTNHIHGIMQTAK